jgi:hypothetical protein
MPDGAFVLLYGRRIGNQSDLFARRSTDGNAWAAEIPLTNSPGWYDEAPFAVAGTSPSVVELYWVQTPDVSPAFTSIARELATVMPDALFASGFDQ